MALGLRSRDRATLSVCSETALATPNVSKEGYHHCIFAGSSADYNDRFARDSVRPEEK